MRRDLARLDDITLGATMHVHVVGSAERGRTLFVNGAGAARGRPRRQRMPSTASSGALVCPMPTSQTFGILRKVNGNASVGGSAVNPGSAAPVSHSRLWVLGRLTRCVRSVRHY